jgi:hypothetical protein
MMQNVKIYKKEYLNVLEKYHIYIYIKLTKLHGLSPQANYTD